MRIDGVTTCVGPLYAGYLRRALPIWLSTLDSLVIVGSRSDQNNWSFPLEFEGPTPVVREMARLKFVFTDAFSENDSHFNKGAGLNNGLEIASPADWILSFDADIIPPDNWREIVDLSCPNVGYLYGARRYNEQGKQLDSKAFYPRGFFQLWHVSDPAYRRQPIFDDWHKHAGHYDTNFANQWPAEKHVDLGLHLVHQGEPYKHWFGPGADPELMQDLKRKGIAKAREAVIDVSSNLS